MTQTSGGAEPDYPESYTTVLEEGHGVVVSFNRRGTALAVGCADGSIVLYDFDSKGVSMELKGHRESVSSVGWSRNGRKVLTASSDRTLILWDVVTQKEECVKPFAAAIQYARLHPRRTYECLVCPVSSKPVLVDLKTGKKTELPTPDLETNRRGAAGDVAAFNRMGDRVYCGSPNGVITVVDTDTREVVTTIKVKEGVVIKGIRFSRTGERFLVNSQDRILRLFDTETGNALRDFKDAVEHCQWSCFAFGGTSRYITGGSAQTNSHKIYLWLYEGGMKGILEGPMEAKGIVDVQWHPVRPIIVSVAATGEVYVWEKRALENWASYAPDFQELKENTEYLEREHEFDKGTELEDKPAEEENEFIDILTVDRTERDMSDDDMDHELGEMVALPVIPIPDADMPGNQAKRANVPLVPLGGSPVKKREGPPPRKEGGRERRETERERERREEEARMARKRKASAKAPSRKGGAKRQRVDSGDDEEVQAAQELAGLTAAEEKAYEQIDANPNAFFYRKRAPGEEHNTEPWTEEEKESFLAKILEYRRQNNNGTPQWGLFSRDIPGRVGVQCRDLYNELIATGRLEGSEDPRGTPEKKRPASKKPNEASPTSKKRLGESRSPHKQPPAEHTTTRTSSRPKKPTKRSASKEVDSVAEAIADLAAAAAADGGTEDGTGELLSQGTGRSTPDQSGLVEGRGRQRKRSQKLLEAVMDGELDAATARTLAAAAGSARAPSPAKSAGRGPSPADRAGSPTKAKKAQIARAARGGRNTPVEHGTTDEQDASVHGDGETIAVPVPPFMSFEPSADAGAESEAAPVREGAPTRKNGRGRSTPKKEVARAVKAEAGSDAAAGGAEAAPRDVEEGAAEAAEGGGGAPGDRETEGEGESEGAPTETAVVLDEAAAPGSAAPVAAPKRSARGKAKSEAAAAAAAAEESAAADGENAMSLDVGEAHARAPARRGGRRGKGAGEEDAGVVETIVPAVAKARRPPRQRQPPTASSAVPVADEAGGEGPVAMDEVGAEQPVAAGEAAVAGAEEEEASGSQESTVASGRGRKGGKGARGRATPTTVAAAVTPAGEADGANDAEASAVEASAEPAADVAAMEVETSAAPAAAAVEAESTAPADEAQGKGRGSGRGKGSKGRKATAAPVVETGTEAVAAMETSAGPDEEPSTPTAEVQEPEETTVVPAETPPSKRASRRQAAAEATTVAAVDLPTAGKRQDGATTPPKRGRGGHGAAADAAAPKKGGKAAKTAEEPVVSPTAGGIASDRPVRNRKASVKTLDENFV